MTDYPPERDTGTLFAIAAVEHVLRGDQVALGVAVGAQGDRELRYALAFLAGTLAGYVRKVHGDEDLEVLIARWRLEALGGG